MIARKRFAQQKLGKQFYQVIFSVSKKIWVRSLLIASLLALLSFPVWQLLFSNLTLPVQIQMAADQVDYVRAYWDDPAHHPHAYQSIPIALPNEPIKPLSLTSTWQIKIEALAQKAPQAKSSQVWVLDIRTPESRVDWSKAVMQPQQWQLVDVPNSPQGKAAVALTENPQSLQTSLKGTVLTITLLRHPWSGRVRVTVNGQVRELDLFTTDATTENLSFKPSIVATKKADFYEISVIKTPWHRLRFVPEPTGDSSGQIRVDSIQIGDTVIRSEANSEFVLPFYFWNQISCAIAATILSFLSLAVLLIIISHKQQQNPDFLQWKWFDRRNQPRAILKVEIAKQQFLILPYQSFKYLLIVLAILTSGLFLTDFYFYHLEAGKVIKVHSPQQNPIADQSFTTTSASQSVPKLYSIKLASRAWHQEDDRIFFNNNKKILSSGNVFHPADGDWIWRSKGFPVSQVAQKNNRILVMGDSFVWGDGYASMNDIWWRQLQRELIRRGYNDVEVIAAGLNGASTHEELEQARHLVQTYKPNLIVWGYVTNDPDERVIKDFDNRLVSQDAIVSTFSTLEAKGIFPRSSSFLNMIRSRKVAQQMSGDAYGYEYSLWERKILEGRNFELYRKTVQALAAFQADSRIPGLLITLPVVPTLGFSVFNYTLPIVPTREFFAFNYDQVMPLFQAENIPAYNTLNDYLKYYSSLNLDPIYGWRVNPANGHPAAASTRFYAVKAADILEANYPAVLGKQQPNNSPPVVRVNDWVPYNLNPTANTTGTFTFQYPTAEETMLRLPVKRPFVQLNMESPVALKEIRLAGTGLNAAALDLTVVDSKLKFDNGTVYSFEAQAGQTLVWNLEEQSIDPVNTIRLSANFKTSDRTLTVTLTPAKTGNES